ncbi:MAG: type I-C CRISPR-associated endonuclease Cas1c [Deltaproteobacteria bacterium]|nr:type I-C CRISPR-associated endonuclease Cas1c [Deltaproteobacteria bacterium]
MKHLLNTLYVTSQGSYLAKEGETVAVRLENETRLRLPMHTLEGIVCFGQVGASPALMGFCGESNVALSFMSENGRFLARVQGAVSGNVLLRREQYRRADDPAATSAIVQPIVSAKIANSRSVLTRVLRDHPEISGTEEVQQSADHLAKVLKSLRGGEHPLDTLRGWEGEAAMQYFSVFDHLIVSQKETFQFFNRNRRPPLDKVNALLSFIYTLLRHDVGAALEGVGLDPGVGFLHRDRPGRPGLALDLMEEFRPYIADRLVLSLINRQQVKPNGFTQSETGGIRMDDDTRKTVIQAYQERKREEILHPFLNEKMALGLLPHIQARLLARHLRGDLDAYPPFIWR